ncbi:hypothetical protein [Mycobacterium cookii]|uniref:hypothetical protein n=1 Tax=Mycobacterium cookii TaxID=1775 RepID=UPI0013D3877D|nr:hypothetical protein [Mycobacterium cookii]MCV7331985.1 hypothetical protein [Mycobacterium cookii]
MFVAYTAIMLSIERRLRRGGGPGIIAFELAGTASRAEVMLDAWGPEGRRFARLSMWLDFGYMASYGALLAVWLDRVRRRRGHSAVLPVLVVVAVAGDAVEGVSLLKVLNGNRVAANARRARTAALAKFTVLAGCLGYIAARSSVLFRR